MKTTYNERSWAIDVISEINKYASKTNRKIKRASGELTISTPSGKLFPDVLLFGEISTASILQGWELKFPDTSITDEELIKNAVKKAQNLGLNSFLLWNVTTAVLYVSDDMVNYQPVRIWNDLSHIKQREEVIHHRAEWVALLQKILREMNDFFDSGRLKTTTIIEAFSENTVFEIVLNNVEMVADALRRETTRNAIFDAEVQLWWRSVKSEYPMEIDPYKVLARINLINWLNKLIFAHILKSFYDDASAVDTITENMSIKKTQELFRNISTKCDFLNIFNVFLGEAVLTDQAWSHLVQFNRFLSEIQFEKVNQNILHQLLQKTVFASKRKIAGQYATPSSIAELLVRLVMMDKSLLFFDPFCGTGTIVRKAYDIKLEYGQQPDKALSTIWASDKFSFPLQIAMLALSEPKNMGQVLHIFKKDVVELKQGMEVEFNNPSDGSLIKKTLPAFDYIASNLPFVQFEDIEEMNPEVYGINDFISKATEENLTLDSKSDLYAYLPFFLWSLLSDSGRLGIIVSNAWLGTEWGEKFQNILRRFFHIEKVVTSGVGRWFNNVEVVTNIVILQKRPEVSLPAEDEATSFITLEKSFQQIKNEGSIKEIASLVITETSLPGKLRVNKYTQKEIRELRNFGLGFNALFTDLDWIKNLEDKLIPANKIFKFIRGERRGWNPMFYPAKGHGIEMEYIRPVLKSPRSVTGLIVEPDAEAFCCSKDIEELQTLGHTGALSWIKKFEHAVNKKGVPLPKVLQRAGMRWYEMKDSTTADFVVLINYDKRLYIGKMREKTFIDQRLSGMSLINQSLDINLCHALLNSSLGLFYIEALGFGRALGALDLNTTKLEKRLFMLNPYLLTAEQSEKIKAKFAPLLDREIFPLMEELELADRREFDTTVFEAFGIEDYRDKVINSLKHLYNIRISVKNNSISA
jgi:type I restriction-modification system DNA methylase subunit